MHGLIHVPGGAPWLSRGPFPRALVGCPHQAAARAGKIPATPPTSDEELPPWAGLAVDPRWADGTGRGKRPGGARHVSEPPPEPEFPEPAPRVRPRGRQAAARARRTRRSLYLWGSMLAAAVIIGGGIWWLVGRSSPPVRLPDAMVTTFQPGEFQTVPNACSAVTASTLNAYLPGKRTVASPQSLDGGAASLCSWTLDARPLYRLLNVQVQAYSPNGLASGDGSATFAAIDAYAQALQQKASPPKATRLPKAAITTLPAWARASRRSPRTSRPAPPGSPPT